MGTATTETTLTESIPTIVAAALLELEEGNVVQPLVTNVDFPGTGIVYNVPKIAKITAEADDSLDYQALDSGGYTNEPSPSATTVGVHGAYVLLKDLASLGSVGDMAAVAGQLIGQCLVTRKDLDLVTLFATFTTNQGCATTATAYMAPGDLYDAYGALKAAYANAPFNLVLPPTLIWSAKGVVTFFDGTSDAYGSAGMGTVGEDFARSGIAGMAMGFNLFSDGNIAISNSNNGAGGAFARGAIINVTKRPFQIEIDRNAPEVSDIIVGTEIRGEAFYRKTHGNLMRFTNT